jgi:hypothetical protein
VDFDLSDEQQLVRETARAFADGAIVGRAATGIDALLARGTA